MTAAFTRRGLLKAAGTIAPALAAPAILTRPGWSQTGPIKIGSVEVLSGPAKYIGEGRATAIRAALDRVNAAGGMFGRQLTLVTADSEYKNDVAARRINDLLQGEKVDILGAFGGAIPSIASKEAYKLKKIFINSAVSASDLTGPEFAPTTFSIAPNTDMLARGSASYAAKSGKKKIFILSYDIATGRSMGANFRKRFEAIKGADQQIVGEEYHPFARLTDFGPYITKVMASGADLVFTPDLSIDQRRIIQQGKELGWNVELVGCYLNDPSNASALGDMTLGNVVVGAHQLCIDTPQNREWSKIWKEKYATADLFSKSVDSAIGLAISSYEWLAQSLKKAGSLDAEAIAKAWEGDKFDTLWGPAEMRGCDHQAQFALGISRFVKPEEIPAEFRVFDFPYIKTIGSIPREEASVPPAEAQNGRCV